MDSSHTTQPNGTEIATSAEQLRAIEALIAHYERLLTEAREAAGDWEQIFDAIEDPICVVTSDYRLLQANAAYRRVFGDLPPVRGSRHFCFAANGDDGQTASDVSPCADCPLPETVRTRRAGFMRQEWQSAGESGESGESPQPRVYQRWTYPIITAAGRVERVVEVIKDVTEQERMRHTLSTTAALREADRLKAELLGTVSHELRSPLTAIKGYATTLLRHERRLPREERREFLLAIGEASDRLEVIINRLLEMSQLETGSIVPQLAPLDVVQVASAAIARARQQTEGHAPGKYVFSLHLLPDHGTPGHTLPVIDADHRLLRDALDNLLENAVKYSPEGGTIEVTLALRSVGGFPDAEVASDDRKAITTREPAAAEEVREAEHAMGAEPAETEEMLEIVVRDSGLGIPEEHLGRVFERFHRVDTRLTREVDGLGVGLAMCKRIAELHNGTIWAESTPGEGSAFHLLLPLSAARATEASSEMPPPVP